MKGSTGEEAGTVTVYQKGDYESPLAKIILSLAVVRTTVLNILFPVRLNQPIVQEITKVFHLVCIRVDAAFLD